VGELERSRLRWRRLAEFLEAGLGVGEADRVAAAEGEVAQAGASGSARTAPGCFYRGHLARDRTHLINTFRAITGRTLETFLQDTAASAA
jgi:hypothetical protein